MYQPLFSSPRASLGLLLALPFAAWGQTTSLPAGERADAPTQLAAFEVTGSRIKRVDVETPHPVVAYTASAIEASGFRTLGDFFQTLPFNSGTGNSMYQSSSFTRGAATANPRGLGSNRFLVLVNGRRMPVYALTAGNNTSVFDLNSIPTAAIDRVEYQKDGASAIYGSDAITGVLNVILKDRFVGISSDVKFENTLGHDSLQKQASVIAGAHAGKTDLLAIVNYAGGHSAYIRDYPRSASTDYSSLAPKGINQNSSSNWPANVNLTAAQAAAAGFTTGAGLYVLTGGVPTANPQRTQFASVTALPNASRYDFSQVYQLVPDFRYYDTHIRFGHEFTPRLKGFAEFSYGDHQTDYGYTPSVIVSTQNPGTGPSGLLSIPARNPYNPFGIDITNFLYRTNFGPTRTIEIGAITANTVAGLRGQLGGDWSWELGASYGYSEVSTILRHQVRAADLQAALNGTTRATALNPWGPSDNPAVPAGLFIDSVGNAKATTYGADLRVDGHLARFELPGGAIGVATGGEARKEKFAAAPDTVTYIGQGGGTPFRGERTVKAVFAEVDLPVLKRVEVQLAGRHEEYTDFGKSDKPKVAAKIRLLDTGYAVVLLRGSYSKSFKAPDLARLYATQTIAYSSAALLDPVRPQDPAVPMRIVTGGNPALRPELGTVKYAGFVIEPGREVRNPWLRNLSVSVDLFDYRITDVINAPSTTFLLSAQGRQSFPDAIVRDNSAGAPGPITMLRGIPINAGLQFYKGADVELAYRIKDTRTGSYQLRAQATYIHDIGYNFGLGGGLIRSTGRAPNPRFVGTLTLGWEWHEWSSAITGSYYGQYFNDAYQRPGWGENPKILVNPSVTYRPRGIKGGRVTLGATNVFNTEPPRNGYEIIGFDITTLPYGNLALGRTVYVRLGKDF